MSRYFRTLFIFFDYSKHSLGAKVRRCFPLRGCPSERPQPAADSPKSSKPYKNTPRKKSPGKGQTESAEKDKQPKDTPAHQHRPQWETQARHTPPKENTASRAASGGRVQHRETHPPAKSKRKAPRRTGVHDVIFLFGLLEDFTQQNERKKNNTHDQKHFYTSSILSLWINTA